MRLRRKDTTKGPPLRILSLDGGGVRGYSMLIILQELMHRTFVEIEGRAPKRHEIPKPCDHFDLIAGTGTGGLIAIMLGRLRLDIDTCKDVYVRMTRRVFETDKRIAGIPYRSTLFKASKLEEAIRECVREHTIFEDEGNDVLANAVPMSPDTPQSATTPSVPQRTVSNASRYSQVGMSPVSARMNLGSLHGGNPNALLYDTRENRTKTAVTAVFKGTAKNGPAVMLRSYDSRKETAPDTMCTIWQAGRATSATGLAFKPIQIGQSVYIDEGAGKYNPAPQVLDEATQNEWPGREVGVFVSIGTGKRPGGTNAQSHEWWEGFLGGSMGDFAEARRRLMSKIEGCEDTHRYMLQKHLLDRQVNPENYYRLNVEVGVGEFGMNEWNRLSDISTNTRQYIARGEVQQINLGASAKLAKIHFAKIRHDRAEAHSRRNQNQPQQQTQQQQQQNPWERPLPAVPPPSNPMAVELPGDMYQTQTYPQQNQYNRQYEHRPSIADQKYTVISSDASPPRTPPQTAQLQMGSQPTSPSYLQQQHGGHSPTLRPSMDHNDDPRTSSGSFEHASPRPSGDSWGLREGGYAPPLPPKTPLQEGNGGPRTFVNMGSLGRGLPYPDEDGPPPVVNVASKPQISR